MYNINVNELVQAIEDLDIDRKVGCWLMVAHQQADGVWRELCELAHTYARVPHEILWSIEDHMAQVPPHNKGYLKQEVEHV